MLDEASRQSLLYLRYLTVCHFTSSQASTQDPVWIAVDPTVKPWFLRHGRVTGVERLDARNHDYDVILSRTFSNAGLHFTRRNNVITVCFPSHSIAIGDTDVLVTLPTLIPTYRADVNMSKRPTDCNTILLRDSVVHGTTNSRSAASAHVCDSAHLHMSASPWWLTLATLP
jgi:hypothetical protein